MFSKSQHIFRVLPFYFLPVKMDEFCSNLVTIHNMRILYSEEVGILIWFTELILVYLLSLIKNNPDMSETLHIPYMSIV